jgi:predicted DsbA family dithiol-disulfide isomerase
MKETIRIELLTAPGCSACENAKNRLREVVERLGDEFPMEIVEVDVSQNFEATEKYGIMSTPALVVDGSLEFVGVPKESELRERILARVRAQRSAR